MIAASRVIKAFFTLRREIKRLESDATHCVEFTLTTPNTTAILLTTHSSDFTATIFSLFSVFFFTAIVVVVIAIIIVDIINNISTSACACACACSPTDAKANAARDDGCS